MVKIEFTTEQLFALLVKPGLSPSLSKPVPRRSAQTLRTYEAKP